MLPWMVTTLGKPEKTAPSALLCSVPWPWTISGPISRNFSAWPGCSPDSRAQPADLRDVQVVIPDVVRDFFLVRPPAAVCRQDMDFRAADFGEPLEQGFRGRAEYGTGLA